MFTRLLVGFLVHQFRRKRDVVNHAHVVEQVEMLEHHANLLSNLVDVHMRITQIMTVDHDLAAGCLFKSVQATQHGGFAGTRRSDDTDHLALAYRKIDAFDDFHMTIVFMQILDVDDHFAIIVAVIAVLAHRSTFLSTILASHVRMVMATKYITPTISNVSVTRKFAAYNCCA